MNDLENLFQFSHIQFLFEMFRTAVGGIEWFVLGYALCIAFFFIIGRMRLNLAFVYPLVFMALTIFNPFLIVPLSDVIGLTERIRRLFWLLPVNLVLAYAFTCLCTVPARKSYLTDPPAPTKRQRLLNSSHRLLAAALCIAFIVLFGTSTKPYLQMPKNIYKTSNEILEISRLIEEDSTRTSTSKKALFSSQQLLELRQYDPSIEGFLRRSDLLEFSIDPDSQEQINEVIRSAHQPHILALVSRYGIRIDPEVFLASIERCHITYIIQEQEYGLGDYFAENGFELIGTAGIYEIYRIAQ